MDNNLHLKFLITQMSEYVYVLELKNNKWYVGKSADVNRRFKQHVDGEGARWTSVNKPIKIHSVVKLKSEHDEGNITKDYMKKYGVNNVRGGAYCQVELPLSTKTLLENELKSKNDACYKCGKIGHFANKCTEESEEELVWECSYCDREFTTKFGCIVHEKSCSTKTSTKKGGCYRCGRDGHYSSQCYASSHTNGHKLSYDDSEEEDSDEEDSDDSD